MEIPLTEMGLLLMINDPFHWARELVFTKAIDLWLWYLPEIN